MPLEATKIFNCKHITMKNTSMAALRTSVVDVVATFRYGLEILYDNGPCLQEYGLTLKVTYLQIVKQNGRQN
jgi:hypothetical protein